VQVDEGNGRDLFHFLVPEALEGGRQRDVEQRAAVDAMKCAWGVSIPSKREEPPSLGRISRTVPWSRRKFRFR
jgi:hypothetical protein